MVLQTPPVCRDTLGWTNSDQWKETCDSYASKYCLDGRTRHGKEYALGLDWNFPELNCCACGKDQQPQNKIVQLQRQTKSINSQLLTLKLQHA